MKEKIICPICKTENPKTASCCSKCGQRFKPNKINHKNLNKNRSFVNEGKIRFIVFGISIIIIFSGVAKEIIPYAINKIPFRIESVYGMSVTVNQNSKMNLPSKAKVTMNFGIIRTKDVKWKPEKIDTSEPGVKTAVGKIDGYDGEIKYTVNVTQSLSINEMKDCTVNNSMLTLNLNTSFDTKWIMLEVKKGSNYKRDIVKVENGKLNTKIYLPFGAGIYNIYISKSSNDNKYKQYYFWNLIGIENTDKRDESFLLPDQNVESDSPEIIDLASSLVLGLKTDREKTLAIHDFVASNIAYDADAYYSKTAEEKSALETLHSGKAVCSGYANLTAALNRAIGIKTKIIIGNASNSSGSEGEQHAWNETFIDGKWIIQDTTWDAGGINPKTKQFIAKLSHKYFDPSLSEFGKSHQKSSEK